MRTICDVTAGGDTPVGFINLHFNLLYVYCRDCVLSNVATVSCQISQLHVKGCTSKNINELN